MVAHERLRKIRSIGSAVDIPRAISEHLAQICEIRGTLGRIVGDKIGPGSGELAMAGLGRGQVSALRCLGIEAQTESRSGEVVEGRAGERGLREHGPALAHYQNVAVADEVRSN